jgi:signal transduction histidine kinase
MFLTSIITAFCISAVKYHNSKKGAEEFIKDVASERDIKAEKLLGEVQDSISYMDNDLDSLYRKIKREFLFSLQKTYHIEVMIFSPNDTIQINPSKKQINAMEYFLSRLGNRCIDTAYHIFNTSENGVKSYICLFPCADSNYVFIEIVQRKASNKMIYTDILLNKHRKTSYYNEQADISYAVYSGGKLKYQSGTFPYPQVLSLPLNVWKQTEKHYLHYTIQTNKNSNEQWVITIHRNLWYETLINTSYIFLTLFIVASIVFVIMKLKRKESFGLQAKVFFIIVGLFLLVFVVLGAITIKHFISMSEDSTVDILKEKTISVNYELDIDNYENIETIDTNALYEDVFRLSNVFFTDINIFDTNGIIITSSRPSLFSEGIVSKKMNANAFRQLKGLGSKYVFPVFTQRETIKGKGFMASYMPLTNDSGTVIAYLNLPFVSQQRELERKIESVISNFAGIYLLIVNIAILIAALISNILTNIKKTERDKAWRELAKQVAHEVKNPLTPMKLSLQHLQRLQLTDKTKFETSFSDISNSIIEQINTLSEIATEFSDYSKLHNIELKAVDLLVCLKSTVSLFAGNNVDIKITNCLQREECFVLGDKTLLIRSFNNLLKNSVQALSDSIDGKIEIELRVNKKYCIVNIIDNGCGISEENKTKIFYPAFTTKNDGSGLGLVVVKSIIESFNGSISFTSQINKGTRFQIKLPLISEK